MALRNYYTLLNRQQLDSGEYLFTVRLNPDCEVYKGHFPNQPVAPGVCQLQLIKDCAELVLGRDLRIVRIKQCKFLKMILPAEVDTLDIFLSISEDLSLLASVRSGETVYVKLKAELQ